MTCHKCELQEACFKINGKYSFPPCAEKFRELNEDIDRRSPVAAISDTVNLIAQNQKIDKKAQVAIALLDEIKMHYEEHAKHEWDWVIPKILKKWNEAKEEPCN